MALELICNEDTTIAFSNSAGPPDITYTGDVGPTDIGVTSTISTKCKAEGKGVCTTGLTFTWVVTTADCPHTSASYNFVSGTGSVAVTATKTKAESQLVLRDSDTGTCAGTWKMIASPFTVVPCACSVSISDAGQTKAKAQ